MVTLAVLDRWIALAREWQPLLAGVLVLVASILFAAATIRAAKIRAGKSGQREKPHYQDLRSSARQDPDETGSHDDAKANLDRLRSLVRSALSSLSAIDTDGENARALCTRIAAFQWQQFPIPSDADKDLRETYGTFLNQFELLRNILSREWSPTETSSVLIQLNANARALTDTLNQMTPADSHRLYSGKRE